MDCARRFRRARPGCGCSVNALKSSQWLIAAFPPIKALDDYLIAMLGAISLFIIPVDPARHIFALDWKTAVKLPWGVLLLFGGGLSLADRHDR